MELEMKKIREVQAISETLVQAMSCSICQYFEHLMTECPTIPAVREMFGDQANVIGQFKPNNNAPYSNTYNSNWRNHLNFSWKPRALQYPQLGQAPGKLQILNKPFWILTRSWETLLQTRDPSMIRSDKKMLISCKNWLIETEWWMGSTMIYFRRLIISSTRSQGLLISAQCKKKENFLLNLIRIQRLSMKWRLRRENLLRWGKSK